MIVYASVEYMKMYDKGVFNVYDKSAAWKSVWKYMIAECMNVYDSVESMKCIKCRCIPKKFHSKFNHWRVNISFCAGVMMKGSYICTKCGKSLESSQWLWSHKQICKDTGERKTSMNTDGVLKRIMIRLLLTQLIQEHIMYYQHNPLLP